MALNNLGLGFVFTARDLASGTIRRVGASFGALDRNALRSAQSYQRNFAVMGAGLAVMGAGAATLAGAFGLASAASEFEQGIARVGGIARATSDQMEQLREAAIQAGIVTQFSPAETVEGLAALAQQGFNTQQSIGLLTPVLDLAAGGMISVEAAAQSVTSAVHVFGLSMEESVTVADKLLRITNATALAAGDMELALGTVARGARLTGQSIDEMLPSVGLLRNTGVDVSVAAQSVSSALTFMSARADMIKESLGVDLVETLEDGTMKFRPFMDIALEAGTALEERFANPAERTAEAVRLFSRFGVGAVSGIFDALKNGVKDSEGRVYEGAAAVEYLRGQMENAEGAAEEFRTRLLDTFSGQMVLLRGAVQTLGVVVGEGFTRGLRPFITVFYDSVTRLVSFINDIPAEVRGAIASVTIAAGGLLFSLGTVVALGAAIAIIAPFIKAIAIATGGLLLAMAPFVALAVSVYAVSQAFGQLIDRNERFQAAVSRMLTVARLGFRGLVQLFTTGELSGAIAEELMQAENEGVLSFIIDLYAIGFRLVQFFRGIGVGFSAALTTLGPSVERMLEAFEGLGRALGFISDEGREAVAGMPSSEFMESGAKVGAVLAGVLESIVDGITWMTDVLTGAVEGWEDFFSSSTPGFDKLSDALGFLSEQWDLFRAQLGLLSEDGDETSFTARDLGRVLSGALGGAADFLVLVLDGLIVTIGAVLWLFRQLIRVVDAIPRSFTFMGQVVEMVFQAVVDSFQNMIDRMIVGLAALARRIPANLRPASLNGFIAQGGEAQGRINTREREMQVRRKALLMAGEGIFPAAVEAEAGGRADARTEAALKASQLVLQNQQRAREEQPWNVTIQLDSQTIARATNNANRRDDAASFQSVSAED